MKTILIAIPTARNIEPSTFKAIYDLEVPEGYTTTFQYFFGYNIDQVRNLIAHWAENFDYLFAVDSDISFPPDTLKKLLSHDVDMVSGLYIQRIPGQHVLEIYGSNGKGGMTNIPYQAIKNIPLINILGCGFGCVLVKSEVFRQVGYPYFKYHSAIDHKDTVSEDVDFCAKATAKGFKIYADTTILCEHTGSSTYRVADAPPAPPVIDPDQNLKALSEADLIPKEHRNYLDKIKEEGVSPKVIYDIGACVLNWTKIAHDIWPDSKIVAFDAMDKSEPIFKDYGLDYHIGLLSDTDDNMIKFYQNYLLPGGNSVYKENVEHNPHVDKFFTEDNAIYMKSNTLDTVVKLKQFPLPDMIKMDVQGAELDVLKGAERCLTTCTDLVLELQSVEYNKGAPLKDEVIAYVESLGFKLQNNGAFSDNGPDGDYHFKK